MARLDAGDLEGAADQARARPQRVPRARTSLGTRPGPGWSACVRGPGLGARGRAAGRRGRSRGGRLDAERADEAPVALIVASRLVGPDVGATDAVPARRRTGRRGTDLVRASGWLAAALERELADDRGGVLRACGRGLDALDEHRRLLGSTELRALATGHGTELAALALRHAADRPRDLLRWSERWRSTALAQTAGHAG